MPTRESVTATVFGSASTTHAANLPATVTSGDLLLLFSSSLGTAAPSSGPSGWTLIDGGASAGGYLAIYAKLADGTEDGGTATVTFGSARTGVAQVYRLTSWGGTIADDIDVGTMASGISQEPDAPSVTAGWGAEATNYFIAAAGSVDDDDPYGTVPTNYGNNTLTYAGAGANASASLATADRTANLATDNPGQWGAFTNAQAEAWVAQTLVIQHGTSGGGASTHTLTADAWTAGATFVDATFELVTQADPMSVTATFADVTLTYNQALTITLTAEAWAAAATFSDATLSYVVPNSAQATRANITISMGL